MVLQLITSETLALAGDVLEAVKDGTLTRTDAINRLNDDMGIDANAPQDKYEAADRAVDNVYNNEE